ncbi:hypothetical protein SAFG77S_04908 [Streptomyces afghaniensis]
MCAWWCWTSTGACPASRAAHLAEWYPGCRSAATTSGATPVRCRRAGLRPPGRLQGGQIAHVADVRAEPGVVALAEAQGVLQIAAHGERGPRRDRQPQRAGHIPPGPAQHLLGAVGAHPQQGVVTGRGDGPVVGEPRVGQPGEPDQCLVVVRDDRFAGTVAAGHDQHARSRRIAGQAEQQGVQGRVGQHDAEVGAAGTHAGREARPARPSAEQDDGAPGAGEGGQFGRGEHGDPPDGVQVRAHHRERLAAACLAAAQRLDGPRVGRVARQVVAAEALDGDDPPGGQQCTCRHQGVGVPRRADIAAGGGHQAQPRTAAGAGHGLGVEAAVEGIAVLPGAVGAHREAGHGGDRPVVRHARGDGEAGPAVGAGDERVPVPAAGRIGQVPQTVRAGRRVGREMGAAGGVVGGTDGEAVVGAADGEVLDPGVRDGGQRRRLGRQPVAEVGDTVRRALHLDEDPVRRVAHESRERDRWPGGARRGGTPRPATGAAHGDAAAHRLCDGRCHGTRPASASSWVWVCGRGASGGRCAGAPSRTASTRSRRASTPAPVRAQDRSTSTPGLTRWT